MPGSKRDANPPNQGERADSTHVRQQRAIPGHRGSTENMTTRTNHKHDIRPGWKEHVESEQGRAEGKGGMLSSLLNKVTTGFNGSQKRKDKDDRLSDRARGAEERPSRQEKPATLDRPENPDGEYVTRDGIARSGVTDGRETSREASNPGQGSTDTVKEKRKNGPRKVAFGLPSGKGTSDIHQTKPEKHREIEQEAGSHRTFNAAKKDPVQEGENKKGSTTGKGVRDHFVFGSDTSSTAAPNDKDPPSTGVPDELRAGIRTRTSQQTRDNVGITGKQQEKEQARDKFRDITNKLTGKFRNDNDGKGNEPTRHPPDQKMENPPIEQSRASPKRTTEKKETNPKIPPRHRTQRRDIPPASYVDSRAGDFPESDSSSSIYPEYDFEPAQTRCKNCKDWILVNPYTAEFLDWDPRAVVLCFNCGHVWPPDMPLTGEQEDMIRELLDSSPFKDTLCDRCQIDERMQRLEDWVPDAGNTRAKDSRASAMQTGDRDIPDDGVQREGHYCKKLDFERDKDDVQPRLFPDDPNKPVGAKKALLIGINYSGQNSELKGCRNDVKNIYFYLKSNGYKDQDVDILLDVEPFKPPTMKNILSHMEELVKNAKAHDHLFVHYSGHGGQTWDSEQKDEDDGKDEGIYPVDHKSYIKRTPKGMLIDDELNRVLAHILPDVHLTCLFDSCHSGSVLDLPYVLVKNGYNEDLERDVGQHLPRIEPRKVRELDEEKVGTVILWSGCQDTETSKDARIDGRAVGAMSNAFIEANYKLLEERKNRQGRPTYTYKELLGEVREILHSKSQRPQLSSTHDLDLGQYVFV